jgi:predicted transcriptional regulator
MDNIQHLAWIQDVFLESGLLCARLGDQKNQERRASEINDLRNMLRAIEEPVGGSIVSKVLPCGNVGSNDRTPEAPEDIANIKLDDLEQAILYQLSGSSVRLGQARITNQLKGLNAREGTVKNKLPHLEKLGFVDRPNGMRSGYAITNKGTEYLRLIEQ